MPQPLVAAILMGCIAGHGGIPTSLILLQWAQEDPHSSQSKQCLDGVSLGDNEGKQAMHSDIAVCLRKKKLWSSVAQHQVPPAFSSESAAGYLYLQSGHCQVVVSAVM